MNGLLLIFIAVLSLCQIVYWVLNLEDFDVGFISDNEFHKRLYPGYFIYHMFLELGKRF